MSMASAPASTISFIDSCLAFQAQIQTWKTNLPHYLTDEKAEPLQDLATAALYLAVALSQDKTPDELKKLQSRVEIACNDAVVTTLASISRIKDHATDIKALPFIEIAKLTIKGCTPEVKAATIIAKFQKDKKEGKLPLVADIETLRQRDHLQAHPIVDTLLRNGFAFQGVPFETIKQWTDRIEKPMIQLLLSGTTPLFSLSELILLTGASGASAGAGAGAGAGSSASPSSSDFFSDPLMNNVALAQSILFSLHAGTPRTIVQELITQTIQGRIPLKNLPALLSFCNDLNPSPEDLGKLVALTKTHTFSQLRQHPAIKKSLSLAAQKKRLEHDISSEGNPDLTMLLSHKAHYASTPPSKEILEAFIHSYKAVEFDLAARNDSLLHILAIIRQTYYQVTEIFLSQEQMSLILNLLKRPRSFCIIGRTEEERMLLFAFIAAFHALTGKQVQIPLSTDELAKQNMHRFGDFYRALGLSAGHWEVMNGIHPTIAHQIIYGTLRTFILNYQHSQEAPTPTLDHTRGVLLLDRLEDFLTKEKNGFADTKFVDLLNPLLTLLLEYADPRECGLIRLDRTTPIQKAFSMLPTSVGFAFVVQEDQFFYLAKNNMTYTKVTISAEVASTLKDQLNDLMTHATTEYRALTTDDLACITATTNQAHQMGRPKTDFTNEKLTQYLRSYMETSRIPIDPSGCLNLIDAFLSKKEGVDYIVDTTSPERPKIIPLKDGKPVQMIFVYDMHAALEFRHYFHKTRNFEGFTQLNPCMTGQRFVMNYAHSQIVGFCSSNLSVKTLKIKANQYHISFFDAPALKTNISVRHWLYGNIEDALHRQTQLRQETHQQTQIIILKNPLELEALKPKEKHEYEDELERQFALARFIPSVIAMPSPGQLATPLRTSTEILQFMHNLWLKPSSPTLTFEDLITPRLAETPDTILHFLKRLTATSGRLDWTSEFKIFDLLFAHLENNSEHALRYAHQTLCAFVRILAEDTDLSPWQHALRLHLFELIPFFHSLEHADVKEARHTIQFLNPSLSSLTHTTVKATGIERAQEIISILIHNPAFKSWGERNRLLSYAPMLKDKPEAYAEYLRLISAPAEEGNSFKNLCAKISALSTLQAAQIEILPFTEMTTSMIHNEKLKIDDYSSIFLAAFLFLGVHPEGKAAYLTWLATDSLDDIGRKMGRHIIPQAYTIATSFSASLPAATTTEEAPSHP